MNQTLRSAALLAVLFLAAPAARAGGFTFGVGGHGHHGSFGIWIGESDCHRPPPRTWVEGTWIEVVDDVWVEGRTEQVWVEPEYATRRDACGRPILVQVRAGYWKTICRPGHFEHRTRRVWQPGHFEIARA